MLEKTFEKKVKFFLKEKGCWYVKYWGGGNFTKSGVPDLLICANGYFLALEIKTNSSLTPLQVKTIEDIRRAGGVSFAVKPENFEQTKKLIEWHLTEENKALRQRRNDEIQLFKGQNF